MNRKWQGAKRDSGLSPGPLLAEEVHTGRFWAALLFVPVVAELAVLAGIPNAAARIAMGVVALLLLGAAALAWSGFHYLFTNAGVEIRTLGFRLRSIPTEHIKDYSVDLWSPIRGYGIRGIGDKRAYVWGNKGVRIHTTDGEVFLGHNEPECIVQDLDLIRQFSH
jgi:hypothetical protein